MGKNHRRRTKQSEQVHDHGWMSGFVSLFDFRRGGGSNHRLPSSSRYGYSQDISSIYDYDSSYDISQPIHGGARKQSVKSLIEEEMVTADKRKHKRNESFLEYVDFANDADTNSLVREILIRIQKKSSGIVEMEQKRKHKQKDSFWDLPERIRAKFIQQLTDATKVLLQEKVIGKVAVGIDGKCQYSREFVEALETLMSHKELLYNLLEDPNSELTRSIDHLINSELRKLEVRDVRSEAPYRYSILETSSGNLLKTKYSFSFEDFKKMLKRAMGNKDTKNVSSGRSVSRRHQILRTNGDTGWMSPSTNPHLEVEIHPRRLSNSRRSDVDNNMEVSDPPSQNEIITPLGNKFCNKNVLQDKQRYYMLTDEILYEKFPKRRDIDLMMKCFSVPDRAHPPSLRPVRQSSMPTARTRMPSLKRSLTSKLELNTNAAVDLAAFESRDLNPIAPETVVLSGGDDDGKLSVESSSADPTVADSEEQNEHKMEKSDNRPSPTSVLEPIYPKDETSPPRIETTKGEPPITPLQLRFEDMENSPESEPDSEWQLKKHVTEILIASGFSWETSYIRYLTSDYLLDISLLDADEDTNSDHLRNNYMLTFDLLNEALEDGCARYFSYSPWVPFSKSNVKVPTTSDGENSYEQIMEEIESHVRTWSEPEDVEQIVSKEMFKDGSLKEFGLDVETIGAEISDLILQKLVIDTALSCFSFTDKARLVHL